SSGRPPCHAPLIALNAMESELDAAAPRSRLRNYGGAMRFRMNARWLAILPMKIAQRRFQHDQARKTFVGWQRNGRFRGGGKSDNLAGIKRLSRFRQGTGEAAGRILHEEIFDRARCIGATNFRLRHGPVIGTAERAANRVPIGAGFSGPSRWDEFRRSARRR